MPLSQARLLVHQSEELLHPGRVEALRGDPHGGFGVILAQVGGLLFEQGHQVARLGVSGVAAGDEDGVDAGELPEDLAPFAERRLDGGGLRVVGVHGGIPDPAFEAVLLGEARHLDHHLHGREGKVRAIGGIVGAGRNELDGVGAEDGEVADVAFPHRDAPGVVGIGLGAVAQLMAAQGVFGRGLNIERAGEGDRIAAHFEGAQQAADAEEDAAFVVADDLDAGRAAVVEGAQAIAFGGQGSAGRGALDGDDGLTGAGIGGDGRPGDAGAFANGIDEQGHGFALGAGQGGGRDDGGMRQVGGDGRGRDGGKKDGENSGHGC